MNLGATGGGEIGDNGETMTPTPPPSPALPESTHIQAHTASPPLVFALQGWPRRILFVLSFEVMAISCSSVGLSLLSQQSMSHASVMGLACSAIAVAWNWLFNLAFESWEAKQSSRHRTVWRRMAHAIGFEIPLLVSFVLLFAWWFDIGYGQAFIMDLALFAFFLVFTFLYTWGFDLLFGQPHVEPNNSEALEPKVQGAD